MVKNDVLELTNESCNADVSVGIPTNAEKSAYLMKQGRCNGIVEVVNDDGEEIVVNGDVEGHESCGKSVNTSRDQQ